jgi:hypothetical protein
MQDTCDYSANSLHQEVQCPICLELILEAQSWIFCWRPKMALSGMKNDMTALSKKPGEKLPDHKGSEKDYP